MSSNLHAIAIVLMSFGTSFSFSCIVLSNEKSMSNFSIEITITWNLLNTQINEIELTFTFALYWSEDFLTTELLLSLWKIGIGRFKACRLFIKIIFL